MFLKMEIGKNDVQTFTKITGIMFVKTAEKIQKQLFQFPLNFKNTKSAQKSILALKKTIKYFD